ncbi:hypothetical protein [Taibaiella chishuiensis]|uniref:YXWGXW repeat-containing protein n=1 Tax=Taibaiella chishuiensis TaxID=1434707 RepID=A0A2P8CYS9_9BACT|nr:hypothetical protein [Taibaiella chishuiensis]PSK90086.1 hypothetical protein B0I18_10992 [Taibaiella chishuiensis]
MKKVFVMACLLAGFMMMHGDVAAQGRGHGYDKHHKEDKAYRKGYRKGYNTAARQNGPPAWAPAHGYRAKNHVYFPDYYTFYDPSRNGYVYWQNNAWLFSRTVPSFMASVDLGRARIQVLGDLPLATRPEPNFSRYYRMYPPGPSVNINIPHPPFPRR